MSQPNYHCSTLQVRFKLKRSLGSSLILAFPFESLQGEGLDLLNDPHGTNRESFPCEQEARKPNN